jgi:hypothetical protein
LSQSNLHKKKKRADAKVDEVVRKALEKIREDKDG